MLSDALDSSRPTRTSLCRAWLAKLRRLSPYVWTLIQCCSEISDYRFSTCHFLRMLISLPLSGLTRDIIGRMQNHISIKGAITIDGIHPKKRYLYRKGA